MKPPKPDPGHRHDYDPNRSWTQREFRYFEHISKTKYAELKRHGLAPEETNIDGLLRITPEAREAWHQRLAALANTEDAKLETERRRELAVIAGKAAAASPLHISKQRKSAERAISRR